MSRNLPILITGCQRSGTTLLSLILDSHPEIFAIDEMDFKPELLNTYLDHPDYHPYVSFKLPVASHNAQSFKNAANMKILWCMRDPRDVVASMIKLNLDFQDSYIPWSAHPYGAERQIQNAVVVLQHRLGDETKKQLEIYKKILFKQPLQRNLQEQVFTAALCWNLKQLMLDLYDDYGVEYQIVSYEHLVASPKAQIGKIIEYLDIQWHEKLLNHHLLHSGVSVGNTVNSRPIDSSNTGKWKKTLSSENIDLIRQTSSEIAKKFGYEV